VRNVTCRVTKDERRFDGGQRDGHAMMIAQRGRFTAGAVDDRGGNQPPGLQLISVKTGGAPRNVIWISAVRLGELRVGVRR
jgi:hypothetical protein